MLYPTDATRKILRDDALPSLNLPEKSIPSSSLLPRSTSAIEKREEHASSVSLQSPATASSIYKSLAEFLQRIGKLKLGACWHIESSESLVTISSYSSEYLLPKFEIFVECSLRFSIRVFGWMLTEDHDIYDKYERSFANVSLTSIIQELQQYTFCNGIDIPDSSVAFQRHVIPRKFFFLQYQDSSPQSRYNQQLCIV